MAGAYAKLNKSLWAEPDWRKLSLAAHGLYAYLLSQPTTDTAGVFPVQQTRWAKAHSDTTIEDIQTTARELDRGGWIIVDFDTEEGVIRHYLADQISAGSNVFLHALSRACLAQSPVLRRVLLDEIDHLDRQFTDRERMQIAVLRDSLLERRSNAVRTGFERLLCSCRCRNRCSRTQKPKPELRRMCEMSAS